MQQEYRRVYMQCINIEQGGKGGVASGGRGGRGGITSFGSSSRASYAEPVSPRASYVPASPSYATASASVAYEEKKEEVFEEDESEDMGLSLVRLANIKHILIFLGS